MNFTDKRLTEIERRLAKAEFDIANHLEYMRHLRCEACGDVVNPSECTCPDDEQPHVHHEAPNDIMDCTDEADPQSDGESPATECKHEWIDYNFQTLVDGERVLHCKHCGVPAPQPVITVHSGEVICHVCGIRYQMDEGHVCVTKPSAEPIGSGHTGKCEEGCQCSVAQWKKTEPAKPSLEDRLTTAIRESIEQKDTTACNARAIAKGVLKEVDCKGKVLISRRVAEEWLKFAADRSYMFICEHNNTELRRELIRALNGGKR